MAGTERGGPRNGGHRVEVDDFDEMRSKWKELWKVVVEVCSIGIVCMRCMTHRLGDL